MTVGAPIIRINCLLVMQQSRSAGVKQGGNNEGLLFFIITLHKTVAIGSFTLSTLLTAVTVVKS